MMTRDIMPASEAIASLIKFTKDTKEPFLDPAPTVQERWFVWDVFFLFVFALFLFLRWKCA